MWLHTGASYTPNPGTCHAANQGHVKPCFNRPVATAHAAVAPPLQRALTKEKKGHIPILTVNIWPAAQIPSIHYL